MDQVILAVKKHSKTPSHNLRSARCLLSSAAIDLKEDVMRRREEAEAIIHDQFYDYSPVESVKFEEEDNKLPIFNSVHSDQEEEMVDLDNRAMEDYAQPMIPDSPLCIVMLVAASNYEIKHVVNNMLPSF